MLLSISLRNSFAKIISGVSKNWAHQTNLILNYGGFCEIFSQNARNIHAESVSIRKFFRSDVECIESVGAVGAVLHNIGCTRHSLSKLNFALVGTIFRGGLLPIRQVFRRLCPCGNRCGHGSRRLPSDSGEILSFCDSARKSLISWVMVDVLIAIIFEFSAKLWSITV